jgi:hypothetical protein
MKLRPEEARATRERLKTIASELGGEFEGYRSHLYEVAKHTQPRLGSDLTQTKTNTVNGGNVSASTRRGGEMNGKLLDSRGILASRTLANGMQQGMASPSTPWFRLTVRDHELKKNAAVKGWLGFVEERMYALFSRTNFYNAAKDAYMQLGCFGTACSLFVESRISDAVLFPLNIGTYHIGLDHELNPERLLRFMPMTVSQLYQKFVPEYGEDCLPRVVRDAKRDNKLGTTYEVAHYIEPNDAMVFGRMDKLNKPYRSYYWLTSHDGPDNTFLSVGGFEERPFFAPRWDVTGGDTYGRSPGMDALPALRDLQLQQLRRAQSRDYVNGPPLQAPPSLGNRQVSLVPRSVTTVPINAAGGGISPIFTVPPQILQYMAADIEDVRGEVDRLFYADLFMAITNMPGVQPRNLEEIASRNEEALRQLGPVVDRNQNEMLRPAIDRAYGILARMGEIPPPPDEIEGVELEIEFVGVLAQMQRMIGVGSIERTAGFIGNLAAAYPEAADKFDADAAIDEYSDRVGIPANIIRSDDQVAELRQARAEQQQAQMMANAAKPVADVANAARLMSETDTGEGESLLRRLLPV